MCYSDAAVDKRELFDPFRFLVRDRCHTLFTMNIAFDRLQFFLEITYLLELYLMFDFLRHSLTSCTVNFIFHIKFNTRLWLHLVDLLNFLARLELTSCSCRGIQIVSHCYSI